MASFKAAGDVPIETGKVLGVRNQFLLHGDANMAHRLQDEEYGNLYDWNRGERQVARKDVPLAKFVQTEEEQRQQKEAYERHELLKKRAEEDAEYAQRVIRDEMLQMNQPAPVNEEDVQLAKRMQHEELHHAESVEDDARLAMELQREELVARKQERVRRELEDQSYAEQLQERERHLAEMMRVERRLLRQHRLQRLDDDDNFNPVQQTSSSVPAHRILSGDSMNDDSYEERQLRQDREMARRLQELEMEQTRASTAVDLAGGMYDVDQGDARLARMLQERERLDAMVRREQRRMQRAATVNHSPSPITTTTAASSSPPVATSIRLPQYRTEEEVVQGSRPPPPPYEHLPLDHYDRLSSATSAPASTMTSASNGSPQSRRHQGPTQPQSTRPPTPPELPPDFLRLNTTSDLQPHQTSANQQGQRLPSGALYLGPSSRPAAAASSRRH